MKRLLAILPLLIVVVLIQLLTTWTGTQFYLTQMTMAAYYSLLIIGLCVLMGYAGQISLGHAGFFAIGGYLSAALTTRNLMPYGEENGWCGSLMQAVSCSQGKICMGLTSWWFGPGPLPSLRF
ncbi:MAG: hypothetical protein KJ900_01375 [Proteobacteria bacterium]|nr:branched-chain amino acid ABC transporter permease [Desulfocapsa sp.]MBU3943486.1 hypothetical protein [Pseudomonadota bacterium]MCG2743498.1 hypothetical protein [Desulfobacteraceae bacterium]MBU3983101.1 hypothetical protein [Pseudomonadota bacterium]MBU4029306.1 hypothetical protein [Pseudomonadota bacterium]